LLQVAKRQLDSNEDAEDTIQEVFLRLWTAREHLETYDNVDYVAMRTLKNICIDRYRKKTLVCEKLSDCQIQNNEQNPHQRLESQENVQHLLQIINQLPPLQQLIVQLKDIDGYEIEEIVKITRISSEAVRMNLSRARKKVRDLFLNIK
jgi:RNA polymerase sigma-70 factor (ECF subfamily)